MIPLMDRSTEHNPFMMTNDLPLLSIIIPVYNAERTIAATLNSLQQLSNESRQRTEVIVVNDGSQDRSVEIVNSMRLSFSPLEITLVVQKNEGVASARNAGLTRARGTHILFLDADDELACDPFPFLRKYPDASALSFAVRYYRNGDPIRVKRPRPIDPHDHLDVFTAGNALSVSSMIFRKDRITHAFDPSFRNLEDWLFWMVNPRIFDTMLLFPEATSANIHIHGKNMSSNFDIMGSYRQSLERVEDTYAFTLTSKQKNNLSIQSAIGSILRGQSPSLRSFVLFPCNARLYLKFIAYAVLRRQLTRTNMYRT